MAFAAGGQTVQAIDLSNPAAPAELGRLTSAAAFPGGADDAHDLVYANGHLFVTAQNAHSLVVLRVGGDVIDKTRTVLRLEKRGGRDRLAAPGADEKRPPLVERSARLAQMERDLREEEFNPAG